MSATAVVMIMMIKMMLLDDDVGSNLVARGDKIMHFTEYNRYKVKY